MDLQERPKGGWQKTIGNPILIMYLTYLRSSGRHDEQHLWEQASNCTGYLSTRAHTGHSCFSCRGSIKAISTSAALPFREELLLLPLIRDELEPRLIRGAGECVFSGMVNYCGKVHLPANVSHKMNSAPKFPCRLSVQFCSSVFWWWQNLLVQNAARPKLALKLCNGQQCQRQRIGRKINSHYFIQNFILFHSMSLTILSYWLSVAEFIHYGWVHGNLNQT